MSLIFDTLQELNDPMAAPKQAAQPGGQPSGGQRKSVRRLLLLTALIVGCLLFSGVAIVWIVTYFNSLIKENETRIASVEKIRSQSIASEEERQTVRARAIVPPVQASFLPAALESAGLAEQQTTVTYRYKQSASADMAPTATIEVPPGDPSVTVEPATPEQGAAIGVIANEDKPPSEPGLEPLKKVAAQFTEAPSKSSSTDTDATTAAERQAERARKAARRKRAKMQRLVAQLESAMGHTDPKSSSQVDGMLQELSRIKGSQDPYVTKMQAYWLIKQGRYEQARPVLERILADEENDLEAGLNLAIIDARTGNRQAALVRLKRMRTAHPESLQVAEMFRKLQ